MSQEELKKALQTARFAHERETELTYTITGFGALLRAVEILVERQDKPAEADSGIVAKLEQKIKMQHAEMGEARARVAELEREQRKCIELITEAKLVMPGRTLTWAVGDLIELHATAKKKVDELEKDKRRAEARVRAWGAQTGETEPSAPRIVGAKPEFITVDGKTPGEVLILAQHDCRPSQVGREMLESAERDAIAVLRAFGQPSQTTSTNAVEVLDKLASYWEKGATYEGMPEQYRRGLKDCAKELREEITKLEAKPAQSPPDTSTESGLPDAVLREKP